MDYPPIAVFNDLNAGLLFTEFITAVGTKLFGDSGRTSVIEKLR
jgi:hypothetical protein